MDDQGSASAYSQEEWCRGEGLWIGNGIGDQIRFQINGRKAEFGKYIDSDSGFVIEKGAAEKIKYLVSSHGAKEDEGDE